MPSSSPPPRRARTARVVVLGTTLMVALGLRLFSLASVLPYVHHPDELVNERIALKVAHAPTRSPGFFNYPTLLFYAQGSIIRLDEMLSGARVEPATAISKGNARTQHTRHWVAGRALTACLGSAITILAAWLATRITGSPWAGFVVGMSTAVSPALVADSRYITPDTYAAFFTMGALTVASLLATSDAPWLYALAGAAAGLAGGSKYNATLVVIAVVVAHLSRTGLKGLLDFRLYLAGGVAMAMFLATTPFALLDRAAFLKGISAEAVHYGKGHRGAEGGSLGFYARFLWGACGPWALAAPGVLLLANRKERLAALPILAFCAVYFSFLSCFEVHFDRNAIPLVAPLTLLGVLGLPAILDRLAALLHRPVQRRGALALTAAILAVSGTVNAATSLAEARGRRTNSRAAAERWIGAHVPSGSAMTVEAYGPWIDPGRYRVHGIQSVADVSPADLGRRDRYAVLAEGMYGRFFEEPDRYPREAGRYRAIEGEFCQLAAFHEAAGEGILVLDLRCKR